MSNKSVRLYESEIITLLALPEEQRGRILTAILSASVGKDIPELDPMENAVFTLIAAFAIINEQYEGDEV